jgi:hypothetical protein
MPVSLLNTNQREEKYNRTRRKCKEPTFSKVDFKGVRRVYRIGSFQIVIFQHAILLDFFGSSLASNSRSLSCRARLGKKAVAQKYLPSNRNADGRLCPCKTHCA